MNFDDAFLSSFEIKANNQENVKLIFSFFIKNICDYV